MTKSNKRRTIFIHSNKLNIQNIIFIILILLCSLLHSNSTEEDTTNYGYGRIHIESLKFSLGDTQVNRTEQFQALSAEVDTLRNKLLQYKKNQSENTLNIACIAFDFFDLETKPINKDLIYFGKNQEDKYYFISGRLPWEKLKKAESQIVQTIKDEQVICLSEEITDLKTFIKDLERTSSKVRNIGLSNSANLISSTQNFILSEFLNFKINRRALKLENKLITSIVGREPSAMIIHEDYQKIFIARKIKCAASGDDTLSELQNNKEFVFVHSEQLAIVFLHDKIKFFLESYFKTFKDAPPEVSTCIMYIYSYNTVCARCSTSFLHDFHKNEGLKTEIQKVLPKANFYNIAVTKKECPTQFPPEKKQLPTPLNDYYDHKSKQNVLSLPVEEDKKEQDAINTDEHNYLYQYILPSENPSIEEDTTSS